MRTERTHESLLLLMAASALVGACGRKPLAEPLNQGRPAEARPAPEAVKSMTAALPSAAAECPTTRAFARGACKSVRGWSTTAFVVGTLSSPPPGSAGRDDTFCVYEAISAQQQPRLIDASSFGALKAQLDPSSGVELSCPVVVPLAAPTERPPEHFPRYVDLLTSRTGRASFTETELTSVRIAVVDTAGVAYATAADVPGSCADPSCADDNPHGRAVGLTIARLLCQDQARCASIKNYVGLPLTSPANTAARNPGRGGSLGSHHDLANAIRAALMDWEAIPPGTRPKLIVNLSVGWHAIHNRFPAAGMGARSPNGFWSVTEQPFPGVTAVRRVIERARCAGALVIAAAGNAIGSDRQMPLYPAGWESEPALTPVECAARGFRVGIGPADAGDPLVYAVTALDHAGVPLSTTRLKPAPESFGGMAPRGALGFAVVSRDVRSRNAFSPMYSGTSMAAAVTSAVAGATWRRNPRASAKAIMERLPSGTCGRDDTRAVDLCLRAPGTLDCSPDKYRIVGFAEPLLVRPEGCPVRAVRIPPRPSQAAAPACETADERAPCRTPRKDDPPRARFLFQPWIHPQPDPVPCGRCSMILTRTDLRILLARGPISALPVQARVYSLNSPLTFVRSYLLEGATLGEETTTLSFETSGTPLHAGSVSMDIPAADGSGRFFETEDVVPLLQAF